MAPKDVLVAASVRPRESHRLSVGLEVQAELALARIQVIQAEQAEQPPFLLITALVAERHASSDL